MPVRPRVGRFAIVHGQAQEEGPRLRSFPRQRPDEDEDELYVLVEPATPASEEYCGQLVEAIGRIYRQETLSITGAVLRALRAAHQQARDWNQRSLREHQVAAGVSCLAVRGRTAYLAQLGPSLAFHVGDGRVRCIIPENGGAEPLGQAERAQPVFSRYQLSPGDLLLLASPRIRELLDEQALSSVLLRGPDEALVELFRLARGQPEFALVLLSCVVEPEVSAAPPPAEPLPTAEEQPAWGGPPSPEGAPAAEQEPPPDSWAPPPVGAGAAPPDIMGGGPMAIPGQPKVRLKGAEADIRYPRATGLGAGLPRVPPLAVLALLALVIIGLVGWFGLPAALEESREEEYSTLVDDARAALTNARSVEDPSQRRALLENADAKLTDAEGRRADDPEVADLRAQLDAALAELDAELVLPDPELVVDVTERVPGPVSVDSLAIGGGGAYLLDRDQERVIAVSLLAPTPDPFVLYQTGGLVGTEVAGAPQHIAWAEELGALLVLDDARRLIAVTPGQAPRLLAVRDAQSWGSADGVAYDAGSLYILDRSGDQVLRYLPGESGFDSEPQPLLTSVDFDQKAELAAVGDALYLVGDDGTIRRLQGGAEQPFLQAGIDVPLVSPASPVPLPASRRLLVADRGNRRIVVFSPEGTFRQQLVSRTFSDLRAIAVDEANGLLYVLVGGALHRTPLPASP